MPKPVLPKKWSDSSTVPPPQTSKKEVDVLAELARASDDRAAEHAVDALKKQYVDWLKLASTGKKEAAAKLAPAVVSLFNAAVDALGGESGAAADKPCGDSTDNPCGDTYSAENLIDRLDLELLAAKIFDRLVFEARVERERIGWMA